jgi:hypothetical protein
MAAAHGADACGMDSDGGQLLSAEERAELVPLRATVARQAKHIAFPRKSLGVLCGAASKVSRIELIAAECASHDVTRMAELLGVSTSGYHTHLHARSVSEPSPRVQRRRDLEVKILAQHKASRGT